MIDMQSSSHKAATIASETSSERAARLRKEDQMEYELRRLEELNQVEAQRLQEPATSEDSHGQSAEDNISGIDA